MHYRRFGRTNLQLSVLSLGTMRFDSGKDAQAVVQRAIALGVNHLETAAAYGASEDYLGSLSLRDQVITPPLVVTSKLTPTMSGDAVERALDLSLSRLQVDSLDTLAIHGINTFEHLSWFELQMWPVLQRLQAAGKFHHLGFSTHGSLGLIQKAIATNVFSFVNLHYNLFFQRNERAIAQAHDRDMGVFIISPADKGGLLYQPSEQLVEQCAPFDPLFLCFRWLLSDSRITTLSMGPAVPSELDWPMTVCEQTGPLSEAERDAIDRLLAAQERLLGNDRCAQCYDCLPCPEQIHIPEVLRLRNLAVGHDMTRYGQYRYGMFEQAGHWFPGRKGDRCTDCGDCLPRCPEQLDIPTLLRDTHGRLKGKPRRRLWEE